MAVATPAQPSRGRGSRVAVDGDHHHLAFAQAVPLAEVARFAALITRCWLVLELIHGEDPQLQLRCRQRRRDPSAFGAQRQLEAFQGTGFVVEQRVELAPGCTHAGAAACERRTVSARTRRAAGLESAV
jgi:hypothetical protein